MPYSHVLLDLDHTLLDSDTSLRAAFDDAMAAAGVEGDRRDYRRFAHINRELWAAVERQEITPGDVAVTRFERLASQLGIDAEPELMASVFAAGLGAHGDLFPGARAVLDHLATTAKLALVTNGLSEIQRTRIDRLDLERYFDAIVVSAEVGAAKPGGEIFDITFEALGRPDKSDAIMVGDSLPSDIRGGADYGIATCWFNPTAAPPSTEPGATFEIARLDELPSIVGG